MSGSPFVPTRTDIDGLRRPYGTPRRWVDLTGGPSVAVLECQKWTRRAACAGHGPDRWFSVTSKVKARRLVGICDQCPVQRQCLAYALVFGERYGIWGGRTAQQLHRLSVRLLHGEPLALVLADALKPKRRPGRPRKQDAQAA